MSSFIPHPAFNKHKVVDSDAKPRFQVGQTIEKLTIMRYMGYSAGHPIKGTVLHYPMHWYECRDISGEYCVKTQQQLRDSRRERSASSERKQRQYARRQSQKAGVSRPAFRGQRKPLRRPIRPTREL